MPAELDPDQASELIRRHIRFYQALDRGTWTPVTDRQRHFVRVCRGTALPQSPDEVAYLDFKAKAALFSKRRALLQPKQQRFQALVDRYLPFYAALARVDKVRQGDSPRRGAA